MPPPAHIPQMNHSVDRNIRIYKVPKGENPHAFDIISFYQKRSENLEHLDLGDSHLVARRESAQSVYSRACFTLLR